MFSDTSTGTCRRPLCTAIVSPTMSGMTTEGRDQVLIGRRSFFWAAAWTLAARGRSTNGPFFSERGTDASPVVDYCRLLFLRCTIMLSVRLFLRVFLPLVCRPHGLTGCGLP